MLSVLISSSCNSLTKDFSIYEIDNFKEALSKNKVSAYLRYTIEDGNYSLIDSVELNKDGTIKQIYGLGFMVGNQIRQYDSLGRLIRLIVKGDTYSDYRIQYKPNTSKAMVSEIWAEPDGILWITHKKYNKELNKILSETRVSKNTDTIDHVEYSYLKDRLIKTTTATKYDSITTYYTYNDSHLKAIEWNVENYNYIEYISNEGLIDSTVQV